MRTEHTLADVEPGTPVVVGDRVVAMPDLQPGDRLLAVHGTGDLLVIQEVEHEAAAVAARKAQAAFRAMASVSDEAVTAFFHAFADRLADDLVWGKIAEANLADVERARAAGRSTTRLVAGEPMRAAMIDGLRGWADAPSRRGEVLERRAADTWTVERRRAPLGVVAFVFEGRPNVFADGAGVLRGANTSVMRIGSDALGTAIAIEDHAIGPALQSSGLPDGAITLVRSRSHAAAHALFTRPEVRLAVARGSGRAVSLLGSIAEQHGIPASLHGTGGGWIYLADDASEQTARNAILHSLDRKVCNTLNVIVVAQRRAHDLIPAVLDTLASRDPAFRLHVEASSKDFVPTHVYERTVTVHRAEGEVAERQAEVIAAQDLGREWEWEATPEVSLAVVRDDDEAIALINERSPRMVASIITTDVDRFRAFYERVDVPYVGTGFTRWVDGQWAWQRPELGLTNWERGRLLGRSGILAGDDVFTVRDVFVDLTGEATQAR